MQVAELVTSEFFEQGDRERFELKLTPSVSAFYQSVLIKPVILLNRALWIYNVQIENVSVTDNYSKNADVLLVTILKYMYKYIA